MPALSAFLRVLALLLVTTSIAHAAAPTVSPSPDTTAVGGINELKRLSADLIARAESGASNATQFRIDVAYYRETLRAIMLRSQTRGTQAIAQPTLLALVRMTALLQSAAACDTGRFIVCPPDLIRQLRAQQRALDTLSVTS